MSLFIDTISGRPQIIRAVHEKNITKENLLSGYKTGLFWRPSANDVLGIQLWFRSEDLPNGGNVSTWLDQSGNGRSVQAAGGLQPPVITGLLNEFNVVEFGIDGDDTLATIALPEVHGSDATLFAVFKNDNANADILMGQSNNGRRAFIHPKWIDNNLYIDLGDASTSRMVLGNSPFVGADFHILSARRNSANVGNVWRNGTLILTDSTLGTPTALTADTPFIIGDGAFEGEVAEILVCNTALTPEIRHKVEGYLAWKYNLQNNLSASHPYRFAIPSYQNTSYADSTALPTAGAGRVNVGSAIWSGKYWQGLRVWQRTVRGYFPNNFSDIVNVNGVVTGDMFATGSGFLIGFQGWIERGGVQIQLLQGGEGGNIDQSHMAFVYQSGGVGSTNKQVRLYNNHFNLDYDGREFMVVILYTNSNEE